MRRFLLSLFLAASILIGVGGMMASAPVAYAQDPGLDTGLSEVGETIILPDTDPRVIAARIINVAFGLIGIIMVSIILYAGFLYMTSGGDAEKTQTALRYIRNAVIGLIIILMSWAITRFVVERLLEATGAGGGGGVSTGPGGGGPGGGGFGGGGGPRPFEILAITPSGTVDTKKVIVKVVLNKNVDETPAADAIIVEKFDGTAVPGTIVVSGRTVRFTPSAACPPPNADRFCLDDDTDYRIRVSPSLTDVAGQQITCGGFSPSCEGSFRSGTTVDVTPPTVQITYPVTGQSVPAGSLVDVNAYAADETGVSYVSVSADGVAIGESAPSGNSPRQFDARVSWDTAGLAPGSSHTLTATAYDVDSGSAVSTPVVAIVRAEHCFNGVQDGGETGLDCGGAAGPDACGACSGTPCSSGNACASGVCTGGICVEQPIITSVSPLNGAPGTYVTIRGTNFGNTGRVTFVGPDAASAGVDAIAPQSCVAAGARNWAPTQVVVEVPAGAQSGPLRLTNSASGLADMTNAPPNPFINDFLVDDTLRPGICSVVPVQGTPGQAFRLVGTRFGDTAASILFGDRVLGGTSWADAEVRALIPSVDVGAYPIAIQVGGARSNSVAMNVLPRTGGGPPELLGVEPASGPVGTYVTLTGRNFGVSTGQVFFRDVATGREALADTGFPSACTDSFWGNDAIIVKVPASFTSGGTGGLAAGAYTVRVVTASPGTPVSNERNFAVNDDPARPGICAIVPSVAPIGTPVVISGERFGNDPGTVTFASGKNGTNTPWSSTEISSAIPSGAVSGLVTVTTPSLLASNGYPIEVRNCNEEQNLCRAGNECCGDGACRPSGQCPASGGAGSAMFAWRTSTGLIPQAPRVVEECRTGALPSPSPWTGRSGGDNACVNATVLVRFTTQVEPVTVSSDSILVFECTGSGSDPCTERADVPLASGSPRVSAADATQDYVTLDPQTPFKGSTTYEVVLTTAIRGLGETGAPMAENASRCGVGNAYCFRFHTRADTEPCGIGSVEVAPDPYTAREQGPLPVDHRATPISRDDACTVLDCRSYDWAWSTSDGRASISNRTDGIGGACEQTATAQLETGDDPVQVTAATEGVTGSGDLYINFIPPHVERHGPDCDAACTNAALWAVFNVALDPSSVNASNVSIQRCGNENCLDLDSPLPLSDTSVMLGPVAGSSDTRERQVTIEPLTDDGSSLLVAGQFYKVTLRGGFTGGIQSVAGVPMNGLNDPEGFAWTFRVRPGDGLCTVDRVEVVPMEKYESRIGARQGFTATPFSPADACSEQGQQLILDSGFAWSSSNENVAVLLQGGAVDTGGALPLGCSGRCTFLGAAGRAGRTAQCGNGIVETTDAAYCDNGSTPWGDACERLPSGGRGGEECDDGNAEPNDECSNTCTWNPVSPVASGGTCGNGDVDRGEECDFGRTCTGMTEGSVSAANPSCTSETRAAQCASDGGTCAVRLVRGCSPTCRNLGAVAGNSSCGNGSVGDGEDCDDGNTSSGDGCSANCLHEGSSRSVYALCGNGIFEPGEACERTSGGSWPATGCDVATCRHTGSLPCATPDEALCCGNGNPDEPGKDCDDGNTANGDGCNAICLAEGSSVAYALPSFCSNGILETGEQCESPGPAYAGDPTAPSAGGDGRPDGFQLAEIVGEGTVDENGRMSSTLTAALGEGGESGSAIYGLQCGFTDERQCSTDRSSYDPETGLTSAGCCSARPRLATAFPPNGAGEGGDADPFPEGVCRNVLISGRFTVAMEESSVAGNFLVAKRVADVACPAGMQDVTDAIDAPQGFRGFVLRTWVRVLALFRIPSALAQRWCAGSVPGTLSLSEQAGATDFFYTLDTVLDPRTEYRVRFVGDPDLTNNASPAGRTGVRSSLGVVALQDTGDEGPLTWHFRTGDLICQLNSVRVRDLSLEHPTLFTKSGETHPFVAHAEALVNGRPVPLSPTPSYAWAWQDWVFSNPTLIGIQPPTFPADQDLTVAVTTKDVVAKNANGTGFLSARVGVTADTVNPASTEGRVVQGTVDLTVNLCENPWPSPSSAPFRDMQGSADLRGTPFENGPFFNFSMTYCRDAGVPGPNEDLPSLLINTVAPNAVDAAQGVLRQYLFTFGEESLQKDGIGVRVASNPLHLSPLDWYRSKGFTGSPQSLTIDGYEAIRDGRTVYVGAANTDGPDATGRSSDIYSNIYLISYNEGAEPMTRQVYDALLQSLTFNTNVQFDVANACQDAVGELQSGPDGLPVPCTADWECQALGDGMRCANFKGKIQRDLARLGDFQEMTKSLQTSRAASGSYPRLATGSYLPGVSTSLWPSWDDAFRTSLGSQTLPDDPVNRFSTCGRCSQSNTACIADADCGQGQTCTAQDGYNPRTCWNEIAKQFHCPADGEGSRFYRYRALEGGQRFELASEFEVPPPDVTDLNDSWWKPAPLVQVKLCTTPGTAGNFCLSDADCRACPAGNCTGVPTVAGACQPGGGQFRYSNVCRGEAFGTVATCGDGVLDADPAHTSCLGGANDGDACASSSDCPGGSCQPNEICELTGPTATRLASCTTAGGGEGSAFERCNGCRAYAADPARPGCFALRECGNGRVDGVCSNDDTKPCSSSSECGGEACEPLEMCDDGVLNGRYGRCSLTCDGYAGFCGDGQVSPGEACDLGSFNGHYCGPVSTGPFSFPDPICAVEGCNVTCSGSAPRCGDGRVDAGEQCDGASESTSLAICASGARSGTPCRSDAECGDGGVCGGSSGTAACPVGQARSRGCGTSVTGSSNCRYASWSSCQPIGRCGDGVKDPLEVCDDGNTTNEDACTNACKRNVCGDGYFFRGVEECDLGASGNGRACTNAEYGSTCTSCSVSCKFQLTQGGYCGDGRKNPNTPEQCDGSDFGPSGVSSLSCKQLGFDYLADDLSSIQCTSQCRYGGCVSCGETPGNGTIAEGNTWRGGPLDGLGVLRKVSLYYRGLLVGITTSSGGGGRFRFRGMNEHSECDQYRIVVEPLDDPRSSGRDESTGTSFIVGPFSVDTFPVEWNNASKQYIQDFDVAE